MTGSPLVVVMGVSAAGKSTVGMALAQRLKVPFEDADSLHPTVNVQKMEAGTPLTDDDRWPWLDRVGERLSDAAGSGLVIACSALKRSYRDRIRRAASGTVFVFLDGDPDLLAERIASRTDHFMPPGLLASQLATLEPLQPGETGVRLDVAMPVPDLVERASAFIAPETASKTRTGAVTIYDVAELAGVSPSAVSRALGKPGRLNPATEARIRDAAVALNFRVNPVARALPTGRTMTVALVVADITNPMIFGIVRGAEKAASDAGYTLVIAESQESGAVEAEALERLLPSVDGVVLATTRLESGSIAAIAARKRVVVINRLVDGVASVVPDVDQGLAELVDHLHSLGHRSIAYLAGPESSWIDGRRWEGLLAASADRGIAAVRIGTSSPTIDGGRDALSRVLASRVSAAVAFNDLIAIGLIQAAARSGVSVPADLSICGFDDIFGAELITPPLTTVRAPLELAGQRAVRILLDPTFSDSELLPTELIVRGSTGLAQ